MKKYALLAAVALLVSACATDPKNNEPAATAESASQAIAAAEAAYNKAGGVGNQWRDTEKLITEAKEAAGKQDYQTAQKLARTAEAEGNLAYDQYQSEVTRLKTSAR